MDLPHSSRLNRERKELEAFVEGLPDYIVSAIAQRLFFGSEMQPSDFFCCIAQRTDQHNVGK